MSLKTWVDRNPLPAAIGIAISSAGAATGVSQYFHSQSTERLQQENNIFTTQLKARLAGIERRVGSGEQTFFDVSRLAIPASSVHSLGSEYRNVADGAVFVDVPTDGGWQYSLVSERDLATAMIGEAADALPAIPQLAVRNVHLWKGEGSFTLHAQAGGSMTFSPMVFIQVVDNEVFTGAMSSQMAATLQGSATASVPAELGGALDRAQSGSSSPAGNSGGAQIRDTANLERELSNLFRGNIALIMLNGIAQSNLVLNMALPNARVDVIAVEKRGNVLYAQSRLTAHGSGEGANASAPLVVVTETFIVTLPTKTIVVRSVVPSRDGRSEAFQWVTRFLAGIRVPLETS